MSEQRGQEGHLEEAQLTREMEVAYRDYAMSVLVSRALPDVRDGLKPVHRRIIYAMHQDLRLRSDGPHKKSARVVGEVLGKYHPHSDQSVYDAMVRLAQPFSLRYPLVDGQGNLGSMDGDNPAAMRYTEVRLSSVAELMVPDLASDTVEWRANFDDTLREPVVLPTVLPNLLVNGANGIAVGMATQIPPHNVGEVCDALIFLLGNFDHIQQIKPKELLTYIKGPDFPTGGLLFRYHQPDNNENVLDKLLPAYAAGRGSMVVQAKVHSEEMGMGRSRLVVTEIPYQTNKSHLIERIVYAVNRGQVDGIVDVRDESDRSGMRICIELNRAASSQEVLQKLFKLTPLQQNFSMSLVALVDGVPKRISLKEILTEFIKHRQEVVRRRSEFDLKAAQIRIHIVEGLLRALDVLDEVIQIIRQSRSQEDAQTQLMERFSFTSEQTRAILAMPLRQLVGMEIRQLRDEFQSLTDEIRRLTELLASEELLRAVIKEELEKVKVEMTDERRTRILQQPAQNLTAEDLAPDQTVWVSVGQKGTVKRFAYRGMQMGRFKEISRNGSLTAVTANTREVLYLFSRDGICQRVQIFRLPDAGSPKHVGEFTAFTRRDALVAAIPLPQDSRHDEDGHVCLVTQKGMIKRINVNMLIEAPGEEIKVINLNKGDRLGWVLLSNSEQEVMLFSARGRALRFREADVRVMGFNAAGVRSMQLADSDSMVSASLAKPDSSVLSVTQKGFAKRTAISEFTLTSRAGKGIIAHKVNNATGGVAGAMAIGLNQDGAMAVLNTGRQSWLLDVQNVPESGRATQGRRMARPEEDNPVGSVTLLWSDEV